MEKDPVLLMLACFAFLGGVWINIQPLDSEWFTDFSAAYLDNTAMFLVLLSFVFGLFVKKFIGHDIMLTLIAVIAIIAGVYVFMAPDESGPYITYLGSGTRSWWAIVYTGYGVLTLITGAMKDSIHSFFRTYTVAREPKSGRGPRRGSSASARIVRTGPGGNIS